MNQHQTSPRQPHVRGFGYPQGGAPMYPGLGDNIPGFAQQNPFAAVPFQAQAPIAAGAKKGLLGGFNMNEIGSLINRMGGIDGIISTMGKVQKIVSSFQQMAPMLRLVAGSLLPGAKTARKDDDFVEAPRKRRRRGRRRTSSRRNRSRYGKNRF